MKARSHLLRFAATVALLGLVLPAVATLQTQPASAADAQVEGAPAPPSKQKRVIGAVHTDAVSTYLDDGRLTLDSRADIDVTGDGVVDLGSRIPTGETLFHLAETSRTQVPNLETYRFLGAPGSTIWMAPQTQNHELIWPGFSTEDPGLSGQVQGAIALELIKTSGPGNVELYLQNGAAVTRTFSSSERLPAWTIGVPQHTHMNWVFSAAGTYTLTFQASAVIGGQTQTATNDYVFVVGDIEKHRIQTSTHLAVNAETTAKVALTAEVSPHNAAGAVQFGDADTGAVLGHALVTNGVATLTTSSLPPGDHLVSAQFIPTWSNDFHPSTSEPVRVSVAGEVRPKPTVDDTEPVTADMFGSQPAGSGSVAVTALGKTISPGQMLTLDVRERAGEWVSIWMPEISPAWRGWIQADLTTRASVEIPATTKAGSYRVGVKNEQGEFLGWDTFTVVAPTAPTNPTPNPQPEPSEPVPVPVAPAQQCTPAVILDNGHIDAFTVSAGAGRAVLQIKEDVTGHNVLREVETVLLRVKASAYRNDIPAGTPGAPAGYVLPLTQNPQLIWPGWDTNRTAASGYSDVSILITAVDGPGRVTLSSQGSFGNITPLLTNGGYQLPGTLRERSPAHTHAQWVFSDAGIYKIRAHAVATNPSTGQSLQTAAHTYVFQVGDVPLGDAFCGLSSAGAGDSAAVDAAVDEAAAAAVAAAQAEAAAAAASTTDQKARARVHSKSTNTAGEETASAAGIDDPMIVLALVGGGVLLVGGIVAATVGYLRRLRRDESELLGTARG